MKFYQKARLTVDAKGGHGGQRLWKRVSKSKLRTAGNFEERAIGV